MKIIFLIFLFVKILFSDALKVYLYTPEININNFKSLKVHFDTYLKEYGDYEFQPFSDKKTFESYLSNKDSVVILSSWHYREVSKKHKLKAVLVAQKKGSIKNRKTLMGQPGIPLEGLVTSAYNKAYTSKLLDGIIKNSSKKLPVLTVPKEIDALMSVGFGMSKFALVSKDSFALLQKINPILAKDLKIYYESDPEYRTLLASNKIDKKKNELISIFKEMSNNVDGKNLLNMLGIDQLVVLSSHDLKRLGGMQ